MPEKSTKKYAIHYYDVWGNTDDGYEVNDVYPSNHTVEIPDTWPDCQIIALLQDRNSHGEPQNTYGFPENDNWMASDFIIDGEPEFSLYIEYSITGLPICELRRIDNDD
jgi:hypothetical protein